MERQTYTANKTRMLTTIAAMAALTFVVTWLVKVPIPVGNGAYLNFGDVVIYMCAFMLGGPGAAIAAGIGSMFADFAVGAGAVYAVPTLIIKATMGFVAGTITKKQTFASYVIACIVGGAIMTFGYGFYEFVMFGASYALASIPYNLIQWVGSAVLACVLYGVVKRLSSHFHFRRVLY